MHYYNEIDADCCAWLRELMDMGCIPDGEIDQRPIQNVSPDDLAGYRQCHFFAGIGVWAYALRRAGWPEGREIWTGSCPCQPFSAAGKRGSHEDERHLWPHFFRLIKERRPKFVLGEQVASKDGLAWIDAVHADMETEGYSVGEVDICAAGFGGPHIRQRLYFCGMSMYKDVRLRKSGDRTSISEQRMSSSQLISPAKSELSNTLSNDVLGDSEYTLGRSEYEIDGEPYRRDGSGRTSPTRVLAQSTGIGRRGRDHGDSSSNSRKIQVEGRGPTNSFWSDAVWIPCRDGKWRPTGPGISPLVVADSKQSRCKKQMLHPQRFSEPLAPGIAGGVGHSGDQGISEAEGEKEAERISFSCGCGAESVITELAEPCPKCGEIRDGYVTYGAWTTPCADDISDRKKKYEQGGSSLSFQAQQSELIGSSTEDPNNTPEARVMRLKGYGNALCAETAIEFVKAFLAVCGEDPGGD